MSSDTAIICTVDVFTAVVDDPYSFGQIAAANSLSDVYAMGGKPICALNIVGFPDKVMNVNTLTEVLKGAIVKTKEADCPIIGGHTITDTELKYGLAVTGIVHPDNILKNSTAKPGDKLILTKPLGIGILTRALQKGDLEDKTVQKITEIMAELNRIPSELMINTMFYL